MTKVAVSIDEMRYRCNTCVTAVLGGIPVLTPDEEDKVLDCPGVAGVPDDIHALVTLLHIFQHQVSQRVDGSAGTHHLARLQYWHFRWLVGAGFEDHLANVPRGDIDVDVLSKECSLVDFLDFYK